jgi:hypothetical protein
MVELANLEATVIQYPEHHPNPPELLAAINYMRAALMQCRAPFYLISDPLGKPIAVDGGLIPPYTLAEFLAFLTACQATGRVCLPQAEIAMTDRLMALLGATYAGLPTIADAIAEWDGEGDTGGEAALFAPAGQLTRAQVLLTAIGNHWQLIQVSESAPLLGCPRGDANCDGVIDFFDIDPFLLALFDAAGYAAAYPNCNRGTADINGDATVDFFDIDSFLACLFTGCP